MAETYQLLFEKKLKRSDVNDNAQVVLTDDEVAIFTSILIQRDQERLRNDVPVLFLVDDYPTSSDMWFLEFLRRKDYTGTKLYVFRGHWGRIVRKKEMKCNRLPIVAFEWCKSLQRMRITVTGWWDGINNAEVTETVGASSMVRGLVPSISSIVTEGTSGNAPNAASELLDGIGKYLPELQGSLPNSEAAEFAQPSDMLAGWLTGLPPTTTEGNSGNATSAETELLDMNIGDYVPELWSSLPNSEAAVAQPSDILAGLVPGVTPTVTEGPSGNAESKLPNSEAAEMAQSRDMLAVTGWVPSSPSHPPTAAEGVNADLDSFNVDLSEYLPELQNIMSEINAAESAGPSDMMPRLIPSFPATAAEGTATNAVSSIPVTATEDTATDAVSSFPGILDDVANLREDSDALVDLPRSSCAENLETRKRKR